MTESTPADIAALPERRQATVSPSGDRVAFFRDATGRNEVHVLDLATGNTEQWTDGNAPASNVWPLAWTADGERVLYHHDDSDGGERRDVYAVAADGTTEPEHSPLTLLDDFLARRL